MRNSEAKSPSSKRATLRAALPACLAVTALGIGIVGASEAKSTPKQGPPANKGKLGQDLFLAIDHRDHEAVKALLKKGADPNSRNALEFMPLYIASASHQLDVMKTLIEAKANINGESPYGTPLTLASATGHTAGVSLLISKGASINHARVDGITPLMMSANAGNPTTVAELVKNKANVNLKNTSGATALAYAARAGNTEAARVLVNGGAAVDTRDALGETPLMNAAKAGRTDIVKMLLSRGAKVNVKDNQGRTPLLLATSYGDYPEVVKALKGAGADINVKDAKGRTAGQLAAQRGYQASAEILGAKGSAKTPETSASLVKSLYLLQGSMKDIAKKSACVSCHHEGLGRMALATVASRGIKVDKDLQKTQVDRLKFISGAMHPLHAAALKSPEAMKQVPLIEMNEVASGYGWLLGGMAAQNDPASPATATMASVLARQQLPGGQWAFSLPRLPMQSSPFTTTALAIKSLKAYAPKTDEAETAAQVSKAKSWLMSTPAKTSDELTFRLLGLHWADATAEEKQKAIEELLAAQRPDGGWAQLPSMSSDAYGTGQALYALQAAGNLEPSNPAVKKGLDFLLRTQDDDGSWFVSKRAIPANNYFDAAFPHGEAQYASFNATCWALMALAESMPKK